MAWFTRVNSTSYEWFEQRWLFLGHWQSGAIDLHHFWYPALPQWLGFWPFEPEMIDFASGDIHRSNRWKSFSLYYLGFLQTKDDKSIPMDTFNGFLSVTVRLIVLFPVYIVVFLPSPLCGLSPSNSTFMLPSYKPCWCWNSPRNVHLKVDRPASLFSNFICTFKVKSDSFFIVLSLTVTNYR